MDELCEKPMKKKRKPHNTLSGAAEQRLVQKLQEKVGLLYDTGGQQNQIS